MTRREDRYAELLKEANSAITNFSGEFAGSSVEESIHIKWVISDAEEMVRRLKSILPEVEALE